MIDIARHIAQSMKQVGIENYSFRTYLKKLGNNSTLPAGKYYSLDLSKLTGFQINANNILLFCDEKKYYDVAQYSPLFCGQVHIIAIDKSAAPKVPKLGADDLPTTLAPVYVMIIEVTPK